MRETAARDIGVAVHSDLPSMLRSSALDAVYIATPTELHPGHVAEACAAQKHILTEKPMAIRVDEAQAMIEAAARAGVVLQVGHSHSYELPIARMREIVASGALGRAMIHTWNFTDGWRGPRRAAEFDVGQGGGVHLPPGRAPVDILRLIGGGLVKSVRATTFDWDESRRSIGAHTIYLKLPTARPRPRSTTATAISPAPTIGGIGEWGEAARPRAEPKPAAALSPEQELAAKRKRARNAISGERTAPAAFRPDLVSCERGDIRQSPAGLGLFGARPRGDCTAGRQESARSGMIAEFADAIAGLPVTHTGSGTGQSRSLRGSDRVLAHRQGNRIEASDSGGRPLSTSSPGQVFSPAMTAE